MQTENLYDEDTQKHKLGSSGDARDLLQVAYGPIASRPSVRYRGY